MAGQLTVRLTVGIALIVHYICAFNISTEMRCQHTQMLTLGLELCSASAAQQETVRV